MTMRHGFVREQKDIKYLILYCLSFLPIAISDTDLMDVVFIDDGFGYFEYNEAFNDLLTSKLIALVNAPEGKQYIITPKGKEIMDMMGTELRVSVRDKAQAAVMRVVAKIRRDAAIKVARTERSDGTYMVRLETYDADNHLICGIDMLAFTERQCSLIENNYKKNAEHVYKKMIDLLFNEEDEELSK